MSRITYSGTPVVAPLIPGADDTNEWPTHIAQFGQGGFEVVDTLAERDAIASERRADKAVLVRNSGKPHLFEWDGKTWNEITLGSAGGGGIATYSGSDSYHDVDVLNFKNTLLQPSRANKGEVFVEPVTTYRDMATYSKQASSVRIKPPLLVKEDTTLDNSVEISLDPTVVSGIDDKLKDYEKLHLDGYISYSRKPHVIKTYNGKDDPESYLFINDSTTILTGNTIKADAATKEITLDGGKPTGTAFFLGFQTYSSSVAQKDGQVTFSVVDANTPDVALVDANNLPIAKTIKLKAGESMGTLYLEALIIEKATLPIKLKINSTCGDIVLNGYTDGLTGVVISEMGDNSEISDVIQQWSQDTGVSPRVGTYDFSGRFISIPPIATLEKEGFKKGTAFPLGNNTHTIDDFTIWSEDAYAVDVVGDTLYVNGSKFFYVGQTIDADRTRLMRGKRYVAGITCNPKSSDFKFAVVFWTGTPNSPTYPILESFNRDGTPHYATGWDHYVIDDVKQAKDGTPFHTTMEFGVSDDAQNMAILAFPNTTSGLSEFGLKELFIQNKGGQPEHIAYLENDKFDNVAFKNMDRVLPTTKRAIKHAKATNILTVDMDIPVNSFYEVKALKIESGTGKQVSVDRMYHHYEPKKSLLTINFGETGDFVALVTIYN